MDWIKIEDETPKDVLGSYICCLKNRSVKELHYSSMGNVWWSMLVDDGWQDNNPVTHWMPLPKAPTK